MNDPIESDKPAVAGSSPVPCSASSDTPRSSRPAMDWHDRHGSFPPCLILDVDNGVDFTFEGMGLKGNRPDSEPNTLGLASTAGSDNPKL